MKVSTTTKTQRKKREKRKLNDRESSRRNTKKKTGSKHELFQSTLVLEKGMTDVCVCVCGRRSGAHDLRADVWVCLHAPLASFAIFVRSANLRQRMLFQMSRMCQVQHIWIRGSARILDAHVKIYSNGWCQSIIMICMHFALSSFIASHNFLLSSFFFFFGGKFSQQPFQLLNGYTTSMFSLLRAYIDLHLWQSIFFVWPKHFYWFD